MFFVLRAMGRAVANLNHKSFVDFARRPPLLGPAAGFSCGRTGSHGCHRSQTRRVITGYYSFVPGLPTWVLVTVALILAVNLFSPPLRESWSLVRIDQGRCHRALYRRRRSFWWQPTSFSARDHREPERQRVLPNGFRGVVSGFQIAFFAYIGAAGVSLAPPRLETADPRCTLPARSMPCRCGSRYLHRCPLAILAVAGGSSPVAVPDDVLPSWTLSAAAGRQLVVVTAAAPVSELRLLLHRANAWPAAWPLSTNFTAGVPAPAPKLLMVAGC